MFGYIRPMVGEMRVRENEFFRAVYCGLCRAMGQHTGCASTLTLSYDFVFLAVFRMALRGESIPIEKHRCALHPLKPRPMAVSSQTLAYCAHAAALLTHAKLRDDIADERGLRRLAALTLSPAASAMRKRVEDLDELDTAITGHLAALSALEEAKSDSIDGTAACFGALLSDLCAWGLDGLEARIAREAGEAVGRFIYVIDAADDAAEDARTGRYNPIVQRYGTDIFETRAYSSHSETEEAPKASPRLKLDIAQSLYTAALCSLSRLEGALALLDHDYNSRDAIGILENIAYLGMPAQLRRVLALPPERTPTEAKGRT